MKKTYVIRVIFLAFMVWMVSLAQALTNSEVYKVQLPIITAESAPSDAELKVALAQVLGKLTGEQDIETNPSWSNSLNHAKEWMLSYQYIPANEMHPLILEVDFDPQAISNLLKSKAPASLATSTPSIPANQIQVIVYGIGDLSAMDGLKNSLRALPSVEQVEVTELSPDEVILNIRFQGGRAVLQQEIAEELNTLVPATQSSPSNDTLTYQWAL